MERVRLKPVVEEPSGGLYFTQPKTNLQFLSTGCTLLDNVMGGGWVLGRAGNIVGPKSTGKTLLAVEASTTFARTFPEGKIFYRESEAAFDEAYAKALGMPTDRVDFIGEDQELHTVEDFYDDLSARIDETSKLGIPGLYVLDSLDALSDKEEMERDFGEASFATGKAKRMGELFRKLIQKVEKSNISLLVISQERDKLGVTFGKKVTRSGGGRALDFYLTHTIWLAQIEKIYKTRRYNGKEVKRAIGIKVRAECEKNKVSMPFRSCEFDILFGFGIDNFTSGVDWLNSVGRFDALGLADAKQLTKYYTEVNKMDNDAYWQEVAKVNAAVTKVWYEIETDFAPNRRKLS